MNRIPPVSNDEMPLPDGQRPDLCAQFETDIKSGYGPRIEDYLEGVDPALEGQLLEGLVRIEVSYRRMIGETPVLADYEKRFSDFRNVLEAVFSDEVTAEVGSPETASLAARNSAMQPALDSIDSIGKYSVVEALGKGGQAITYKAWDPDLERHVVIKLYHISEMPEVQETVLREGRSLARVRSPYVAQCHGVDRFRGDPYLVLQYIPGQNLASWANTARLDAIKSLNLIAKVAEGLAEVHASGLLHRDIKPGNIIIADDRLPRLVDFGLAMPQGHGDLKDPSGTLAYMAPEQARGEVDRIDPRTDLFGLGATLYHLLTGRPPHQEATETELWEAAKRGKIVPPNQHNPAVANAVNDLCMRCLACDPTDRFSSAAELGQAIERIAQRARRRRFLAIASACVVLVSALIGAAFFLQSREIQSPTTPTASTGLEITKMQIEHAGTRDGEFGYLGLLGIDERSARGGDFVEVLIQFSEPSYAYVLSLEVNGDVKLTLPAEAETPPAKTKALRVFPGDYMFQLNPDDGGGTQGFAVLASRGPLPAFAEWKANLADIPWQRTRSQGVWEYDGEKISLLRPPTRGTKESPVPAEFRAVCDFLGTRPGIDSTRSVLFPVTSSNDE